MSLGLLILLTVLALAGVYGFCGYAVTRWLGGVSRRGGQALFLLVTVLSAFFVARVFSAYHFQASRIGESAAVWTRFSPPAGGFSVEMPGTPVASQAEIKTSRGNLALHQFALTLGHEGLAFGLNYLDYRAEGEVDLNRAFDEVRDEILAGGGGIRLKSQRDHRLGSHPGRDMVFEFSALQNRVWVVSAGARHYQLSVVGNAPNVSGPLAERFFDSFRVP